MNLKLLAGTCLMLALFGQNVSAQTSQESAKKLGQEAVKLEDEGKFDDAIKLLEQAQKLDPESLTYPYELAYSYYGKEDYAKAITYLEALTHHPAVIDRVFQLLGNSYDYAGQSDKALDAYDRGLKVFPASGKLYLEKGNIYWGKKQYDKALPFYEQGIKAEPSYPSNYYRATRIYCGSSEAMYGMIYGEIFMNLERNTKRTAEISKLLYDTYKSNIKINGDSTHVSFSKNVISTTDVANGKMPFSLVYEPTLAFAIVGEKEINSNSLDHIRSKFLDFYLQRGFDKSSPNVLFNYQKTIKDAGNLEAYNHWLLMKGDEASFNNWQSANDSKWKSFIDWYSKNAITIDQDHKFTSGLF